MLFARTSRREGKHKQFTPSAGRNRQIAGQLLRHTRRTLRRTGLPYVVITEQQQVGNTFGERISHAVATVFGQGYERVLVLGSDCPQLDAPRLHQAAELLAQGQPVCGPATDGGAYLIGLDRDHFDADHFSSLAWETDQLYTELSALLSRQRSRSVAALPALSDIDNLSALRQLLQQLRRYIDLRGLMALLVNQSAPFTYRSPVAPTHAARATAGRAPPSLY